VLALTCRCDVVSYIFVHTECECFEAAAADDGPLSYRTCASYKFRCVSTGQCISDSLQCDGNCGCADCSDERDCGKSPTHSGTAI